MACYDRLNVQTLLQRQIVLLGRECSCLTLVFPVLDGIIVYADALHTLSDFIHQHACPVVVVVRSPRCNAEQMVVTLVAQIGVELTELVGIVFRCHVAATSPSLVADAEIFYLPRFLTSVLTAQTSHRCVTIAGHVLYPLGHLFDGSTTHIATDIRFAAQQFAEVQELMGAKRVVLDGASPVVVSQGGALFPGTYAVHPVVVVGKASSRPAQYGYLQCFQCVEDVFSISLDIRNRRVFTHPESSIDARPQVFGKLSVNLAVDFRFRLVGIQRCRSLLCLSCQHRCQQQQSVS